MYVPIYDMFVRHNAAQYCNCRFEMMVVAIVVEVVVVVVLVAVRVGVVPLVLLWLS